MLCSDGETTLSVQELIDKLLRIPGDKRGLPVFTEGCDCIGSALGVTLESYPEQVVKDGKFTAEYIDVERILISRTQSQPDTY